MKSVSFLNRPLSFSDETRTSYLLQGVESAWDSVGRRKPQRQTQLRASSSAFEGAAGGGASSSSSSASFKPQEVREAAEEGESPRGAEAMLDVPRKGNNVSF